MKATVKKTLIGSGKVLFAVLAIGWLVHSHNLNFPMLMTLFATRLIPLLVACVAANLLLGNWRWVLLLRASGFSISFWEAMPLTLIGLFFNFTLPGGVGGDVVKGYYLVKGVPSRKLDAAMSVLLDRLIGLFCMLLMALGAVFLNFHFVLAHSQLAALALLIGLAVVLFIVMCLIVFTGHLDWIMHFLGRHPSPWISSKIERIHLGMKSFRSEPTLLLKTLAISFLAQSASIIFIGSIAYWLKPGFLSIPALVFTTPLGFIATIIPVSVAGIGVGQAAFLFLIKIYTGVANEVGPDAITAFQVVQFGWGLIGAFFYLKRRNVLSPAFRLQETNVIDQRTVHSS